MTDVGPGLRKAVGDEGQQQGQALGSGVSEALASPCPGPEDWCCFPTDVRKARLREAKYIAQGHTVSLGRPGSDPAPVLFL